jgi:hypothetical protein
MSKVELEKVLRMEKILIIETMKIYMLYPLDLPSRDTLPSRYASPSSDLPSRDDIVCPAVYEPQC